MKKLLKLKKDKKGFTLIEMIVVIVIIAILAAIAVPAVMTYINDARDSKLISQGHGAMTTVQADLAKAQAISTDGKFESTDFEAALALVKTNDSTVEDVKICTEQVSETATKCTDASKAGDVSKIRSFIVKIGEKYVYIPINGATTPFVSDKAPTTA